MKPKIYVYGRRVNGQFDSFKSSVRRITRTITRYAIVSGMASAFFFAGAFLYSTSTVDAQSVIVTSPLSAPVLDRIADCESGHGTKGSATQFRNGQVILKANKNGSSDIGEWQINSIWFKKATELGFDLSTEKGNRAMAEWLYLNHGTSPWSASAKCWNI